MPAQPGFIYLIGRVDRAVRTELARRLRPLELSVAQFTTLSVLDRQPGLSNAQLARRALVTPQSMSEVLAALERRGLVARRSTPVHARIRQATLTPAGASCLAAATTAAAELQDELLTPLTPAERDAGLAALQSILRALPAGASRDA